MLEQFYNFLISLTQSILSVFKIMLRAAWFPKRHQAETSSCLILGNGPSLKKVLANQESALLKSTLICVNNFPNTAYYQKLRPRYYLVCSPEFWATNTTDPHGARRQQMIRAAIERTSWPMTFFIPYASQSNPDFINQIKRNKNIELLFYNTAPIEGLAGISNWLMSKRLGSPRPHNVLIPAILNAINSGFKKIYLIGADHSWLPLISVNDENIALLNQQHFYDSQTSTSQQMYLKGVRPRRLHEMLEKFMLSFKAYFELKDFADTKGVEVINCTPDSFIDAFPREKLENILSE